MNTDAHATRPSENTGPSERAMTTARRPARRRSWTAALRASVASVAAAAVVAVGGASMLTTQDAASAGVTQHNYAILTSASQTQSSTIQNDKKSGDN